MAGTLLCSRMQVASTWLRCLRSLSRRVVATRADCVLWWKGRPKNWKTSEYDVGVGKRGWRKSNKNEWAASWPLVACSVRFPEGGTHHRKGPVEPAPKLLPLACLLFFFSIASVLGPLNESHNPVSTAKLRTPHDYGYTFRTRWPSIATHVALKATRSHLRCSS